MNQWTAATQDILGLRLSPSQINKFDHFQRELVEWNTRFNLTAIHKPTDIYIKHFLDSLTCHLAMSSTKMDRVVDVGSGAGFPGIPLKILCPEISLTLIESIQKKVGFMNHIVKTLALKNVVVIHNRAEQVSRMAEHREQYDWAIARAVAQLPVLVEYLMPFVKVGGYVLAQKGETGPAETQSSEYAIHLLGGKLNKLYHINLPGVVEDRYLVLINKIATTPLSYPRRAGIPSKRPLKAA